MKNRLTLLLLLTVSFFSSCKEEAKEIVFFKGTFEEALQSAQKENKYIFVDISATWCGPCKKMEKYVFTNEQVAKYYNKNFICLKYLSDVDIVPAEIKEIAGKSYPTFLFYNAKGNLVHRETGGLDSKAFIDLGITAKEGKQTLEKYKERFDQGERAFEFLLQYATALSKAKQSTVFLDDLLEPHLTAENIITYFDLDLFQRFMHICDSKMLFTAIDNMDLFGQKYGKDKISGIVNNYIASRCINCRSKADIELITDLADKAKIGNKKEYTFKCYLSYYLNNGQFKNIVSLYKDDITKNYSNDASKYKEAASLILKHKTFRKYHIQDGINFAKKALQIEKTPDNYWLCAFALYKQDPFKNKKEILSYVDEIRKLGKNNMVKSAEAMKKEVSAINQPIPKKKEDLSVSISVDEAQSAHDRILFDIAYADIDFMYIKVFHLNNGKKELHQDSKMYPATEQASLGYTGLQANSTYLMEIYNKEGKLLCSKEKKTPNKE